LDPSADPNIQVPPTPEPGTNFPSKWIFTGKDNNVVIYLPDVETKKYAVKFFDELDNLLFELNNLKDDYLIIEKVNFKKSGWYHFELFESGNSVEKNRFFIGKDGKVTNDTPRKAGNR
jgi:hypothetical protein